MPELFIGELIGAEVGAEAFGLGAAELGAATASETVALGAAEAGAISSAELGAFSGAELPAIGATGFGELAGIEAGFGTDAFGSGVAGIEAAAAAGETAGLSASGALATAEADWVASLQSLIESGQVTSAQLAAAEAPVLSAAETGLGINTGAASALASDAGLDLSALNAAVPQVGAEAAGAGASAAGGEALGGLAAESTGLGAVGGEFGFAPITQDIGAGAFTEAAPGVPGPVGAQAAPVATPGVPSGGFVSPGASFDIGVPVDASGTETGLGGTGGAQASQAGGFSMTSEAPPPGEFASRFAAPGIDPSVTQGASQFAAQAAKLPIDLTPTSTFADVAGGDIIGGAGQPTVSGFDSPFISGNTDRLGMFSQLMPDEVEVTTPAATNTSPITLNTFTTNLDEFNQAAGLSSAAEDTGDLALSDSVSADSGALNSRFSFGSLMPEESAASVGGSPTTGFAGEASFDPVPGGNTGLPTFDTGSMSIEELLGDSGLSEPLPDTSALESEPGRYMFPNASSGLQANLVSSESVVGGASGTLPATTGGVPSGLPAFPNFAPTDFDATQLAFGNNVPATLLPEGSPLGEIPPAGTPYGDVPGLTNFAPQGFDPNQLAFSGRGASGEVGAISGQPVGPSGAGLSTVPGTMPGTALAPGAVPGTSTSSFPAATGPAAAASSGGLGSALRGLGGVGPLAGFAGLALLASRGAGKLPAQDVANEATATRLNQAGAQNFSNVAAGIITGPQQSQLDQFKQDQLNQLRQQFYRMGRDPQNDSAFLQASQQIDQQVSTMRQQFLDAAFSQGIQETGLGTSVLTNIARDRIAQDTAFTNALSNALGAFARIVAGSNITSLVSRAV